MMSVVIYIRGPINLGFLSINKSPSGVEMKYRVNFTLIYVSSIIASLILNSCAELNTILQSAGVKKPTVTVDKVKMTNLTFQKVDLKFDLNINNPNSIAISLAGFDYDFLLNNSSFIKGDNNEPVEIKEYGNSIVSIPISLTFKNIYSTYQNITQKDSLNYALKTGLSFDLPVLGKTRIPIETEGMVPAIKLPGVSLASIKLGKIGFTSVDLVAAIKIDNPNAFDLGFEKFGYQLDIAGKNWLSGVSRQSVKVNNKQETVLELPISLNVLEMGQSVINMISGGTKLDYKFSGNADLTTSIPLLETYKFNYDKNGKVDILK